MTQDSGLTMTSHSKSTPYIVVLVVTTLTALAVGLSIGHAHGLHRGVEIGAATVDCGNADVWG